MVTQDILLPDSIKTYIVINQTIRREKRFPIIKIHLYEHRVIFIVNIDEIGRHSVNQAAWQLIDIVNFQLVIEPLDHPKCCITAVGP